MASSDNTLDLALQIRNQGPKRPLRIRIDFDNTLFNTKGERSNQKLPVDPYAYPVIWELVNQGHDVRILTCRKSDQNHTIKNLLRLHGFPNLPIINAPHKNIVAKLRYEWDILIDDNELLYLNYLDREGEQGRKLIIYSQWWNAHLDPRYLAFDWRDVHRITRDTHT